MKLDRRLQIPRGWRVTRQSRAWLHLQEDSSSVPGTGSNSSSRGPTLPPGLPRHPHRHTNEKHFASFPRHSQQPPGRLLAMRCSGQMAPAMVQGSQGGSTAHSRKVRPNATPSQCAHTPANSRQALESAICFLIFSNRQKEANPKSLYLHFFRE